MKYLYLLLFSCLVVINSNAQQKINAADLEVRDSSGTLYPAALWQRLVFSGKFAVKMNRDGKTAILVPVSEEQMMDKLMSMPKPKESNFFKTGSKITSFSEKDMNGTRFNLKDLGGKVVVLNFWFINCPPCRQEIPQLNELVEEFRDKEVVFIGIALDEKYLIKEFLKTMPFSYHIIDNARIIAQKYGVNLYPTHVVLDKQGKVLFHTSGLAMNTVAWVKKSINEGLSAAAAQ